MTITVTIAACESISSHSSVTVDMIATANDIHLARLRDLDHLRLAALFEGLTLLALLAVAVPLKHLAGIPLAVSIAGPVHGLAFLAYLWLTINIAAGAGWSTRDVGRLLAAAFVPFGFISTLRFLRRRRAESAA